MTQQGLTAIYQGRISFIIAHRLYSIRTAYRILVIEQYLARRADPTRLFAISDLTRPWK